MIDWDIGAHLRLPLWYHLAAFIGEGEHAVPHQGDRGVLRVHVEHSGYAIIWQTSTRKKTGILVSDRGIVGVMTDECLEPTAAAQKKIVRMIAQRLLAIAAKEARA